MIWHPAPRGLIQAAAVERWTRDKPAPDLVAYLWIWSQKEDGENPTRRQIARLFGWTEHYSRKMLARVKHDHQAWVAMVSPQLKSSHRPPIDNDFEQLRTRITQKSPRKNQKSPDREREFTSQNKNKTRTEEKTLRPEDEIWQALK